MNEIERIKNLCKSILRNNTIFLPEDKVGQLDKEYNNLIKEKRNAEYLAMLDKSFAEAESGGFITKKIAELEDYE